VGEFFQLSGISFPPLVENSLVAFGCSDSVNIAATPDF
jgi:hypothetical protein